MGQHFIDRDGGLPPTVPPPDWLPNVACYTPKLLNNISYVDADYVDAVDVAKAVFIGLTATLAVLVNVAFVAVLNAPSYAKRVRLQPRMVLTVMSLNDLVSGGLVLGVGVYPALFECWPHGQFVCQLQV